jgi:hypothetical protein
MLRVVYNDKSVSSMLRPADPRVILFDDQHLVRLVLTMGLRIMTLTLWKRAQVMTLFFFSRKARHQTLL